MKKNLWISNIMVLYLKFKTKDTNEWSDIYPGCIIHLLI